MSAQRVWTDKSCLTVLADMQFWVGHLSFTQQAIIHDQWLYKWGENNATVYPMFTENTDYILDTGTSQSCSCVNIPCIRLSTKFRMCNLKNVFYPIMDTWAPLPPLLHCSISLGFHATLGCVITHSFGHFEVDWNLHMDHHFWEHRILGRDRWSWSLMLAS